MWQILEHSTTLVWDKTLTFDADKVRPRMSACEECGSVFARQRELTMHRLFEGGCPRRQTANEECSDVNEAAHDTNDVELQGFADTEEENGASEQDAELKGGEEAESEQQRKKV